MWLAFVSLISLGYQGLALYTCFPLFCKYHDQLRLLILGWRPVTHLVFWHIGGFKFIYIVNLRNMEDSMIFVLVHSATNNLWSMRLHRYRELVFCNYVGIIEIYVPANSVVCFVFVFFIISTEYAWASVYRFDMCMIFLVRIFYALVK